MIFSNGTFQFLFPALIVSIGMVLLCFYLQVKKKRAAYDVNTSTEGDNTASVRTVSVEDQEEVNRCFDRFPPRYSTVDLPPPYSLFDPKLTNVWPGGAPPAYEMYPITIPLAPHHWMTPTEPQYPVPSPSRAATAGSRPQPQRLQQTSTT